MKIKFLQGKTFVSLTIVFALMFIAWGDSILPKPLSDYSRNTRHKLNQVLLGIVPNIDTNSKKPSHQREEQIEKFQN